MQNTRLLWHEKQSWGWAELGDNSRFLFCVNLQQYLPQVVLHCYFLKKNISTLVSKAAPGGSSKTKIWLQLDLATLLLSLMLALDGGLVRPRGGPHHQLQENKKTEKQVSTSWKLASVLKGLLCTPLIMIGYKKCSNNVENNGPGLKVLLQNNAGGRDCEWGQRWAAVLSHY